MKRTVNLREMSATSTASPSPQESQTKKIMMDLQQEKKRLRMLQQGSTNVTALPPKHQPINVPANNDSNQQVMVNQRNALQMAHSSCFGYFIPQSSAFGNIILPVIPRVGPNE
uniref:SOSS complex subunit C n=1 Tax=Phallusia mammillata TaxID=59560 RepID=A0A6F9DF61_9ASCI|nr:SOSS complex subunit C [Phallusia mammillata]